MGYSVVILIELLTRPGLNLPSDDVRLILLRVSLDIIRDEVFLVVEWCQVDLACLQGTRLYPPSKFPCLRASTAWITLISWRLLTLVRMKSDYCGKIFV
jgi:hypothetical protein